MEIKTHSIKTRTRHDIIHLYAFSDVHCGSGSFNEELFKEYVAIIKADPHAIVIGAGDMIDVVNPHDAKRFSYASLPDDILSGSPREIKKKLQDVAKYQADRFLKLVKPIAKKIIGFTLGNHEDEFQKHYNYAIHQYICEQLDIQNLQNSCIVNLHCECGSRGTNNPVARLYKIFVTHGCQSGRTAGSKNNALARLMNIFDVDLVLQGHSHTPGTETVVRIGTTSSATKPVIVKRECRGVNLGSFTSIYTLGANDYAEKKLYNPPPALFYRIDIKPFHGAKNLPITKIVEIMRD